MFYVYKWFNVETNVIFYVGKGCNKRYKEKSHRNKLFREYIKNNQCSSEIIKTFETEKDAFEYERNIITELKSKGQCFCNLDNGGIGGVNFVWAPEMRENKSKNNPMKSSLQRKRMSENNPMKNPEIKKKVIEKISKKPIINGTKFESVIDASIYFNVNKATIWNWCKRGYDTNGNPCHYYGENQKDYVFKKSGEKQVIIGDMQFNSVKQAAEYFNSYSEKIIRAIKNNKKVFGLECKYGNQQPSQGKSE